MELFFIVYMRAKAAETFSAALKRDFKPWRFAVLLLAPDFVTVSIRQLHVAVTLCDESGNIFFIVRLFLTYSQKLTWN